MTLRDRIAAAIHADLTAHKGRLDMGLLGIVPRLTDAVLAVLPAETRTCDCPSQDAPEHMFSADGCTCRPWTRQTDPPRYLDQPGDSVDMISGWERGADCLHHAPPGRATHAERRDRFAAVIYEHHNPGDSWAQAHTDDLFVFQADADIAMTAADIVDHRRYAPPTHADIYREVAARLDLCVELERVRTAGVTALPNMIRRWADELPTEPDQAVTGEARPRCPHCQLPHDLTPGSAPAVLCAAVRQRITMAERLHREGDHHLCCRADCDVLQQRAAEAPEVHP
jgi:hypothetical protein